MFPLQGVCLVPCHSVRGPGDPPCSFVARVLPSRLGIIKIIPQPSAREPLCYSAGSGSGSVKSLPITVSGTMVYSGDHSP